MFARAAGVRLCERMYEHGTEFHRSGGSFPRAKATSQRLRRRALRCPDRRTPPTEHALAFKRYLCLLLEEGRIAQLQLTLRPDVSDSARTGVLSLCHGARVMAFVVDRTTLLVAAGLPITRALAESAGAQGVLGRRLQSRLKKDFGTARPALSPDERQRMIFLNRALAAVARVDLPRARAFADAGFDLAMIYNSPQCP